MLRAISHPHVDVIGHPTGRKLLRRPPYAVNVEAIIEAAARHHVALEINSQVARLDLNDVQSRMARDRGVALIISSDAHSRAALDVIQWGTVVARRAWLQPADVLNTRGFDDFRACLRRNLR
jgi:DNA polymerase (family 10)